MLLWVILIGYLVYLVTLNYEQYEVCLNYAEAIYYIIWCFHFKYGVYRCGIQYHYYIESVLV